LANQLPSRRRNRRRYPVNHEFAHALEAARRLPKSAEAGTYMLQQTKGLQGRRKNPWPLVSED
jgi:hypothetical protein